VKCGTRVFGGPVGESRVPLSLCQHDNLSRAGRPVLSELEASNGRKPWQAHPPAGQITHCPLDL